MRAGSRGAAENFQDAVQAAYEAALDPTHWEHVAQQFAKLLNCHQSIIVLPFDLNARGEGVVTFNIDDEIRRKYLDLLDQDLWLQRMLCLPTGATCRSDSIVPLSHFKHNEFFHEVCAPADVQHMGGGILLNEPGEFFAIAGQRSASVGPIRDREVDLIRRLQPHLARAGRLWRTVGTLQRRVKQMENALQQLTQAILILNEYGAIEYCNPSAERVLDAQDGLFAHRGQLSASTSQETFDLRRAIKSAVATSLGRGLEPGGFLRITRLSGRSTLHLLVCPLGEPGHAWGEHAAAAVFITDLEDPPALPKGALPKLYGLTRAEAKLCGELLQGQTVNEYADANALSPLTVRTQLKSVFRKCGVSSQSELMLRLCRIALETPTS